MSEVTIQAGTPAEEAERVTLENAIEIPTGYTHFTFFTNSDTGETHIVFCGPDLPAMEYLGGEDWQRVWQQGGALS